MQPNEAPAFKQLMQGVYDFYARDLSEFALGIWWNAMRPYEFAEVKHAINRHVVDPDSGQFIPKPADVVRVLDGNRQDGAAMAWAKVMKALRGAWASQSLLFDDPAIHAAIRDMGGWPQLAMVKTDELPFRQKDFETKYRAYRNRERFDFPAILEGTGAAHNARLGFPVDPPLMIGDPAKCAEVKRIGDSGTQPLPAFTRAIQGLLERQA